MIEQYEGLDRIVQLQYRKSGHISPKSVQIIAIFYPDDDQTDEEIAPRTIKADEFKENGLGGNKGHKGGKKATERNLATSKKTTTGYNDPGRGQYVKRKN